MRLLRCRAWQLHYVLEAERNSTSFPEDLVFQLREAIKIARTMQQIGNRWFQNRTEFWMGVFGCVGWKRKSGSILLRREMKSMHIDRRKTKMRERKRMKNIRNEWGQSAEGVPKPLSSPALLQSDPILEMPDGALPPCAASSRRQLTVSRCCPCPHPWGQTLVSSSSRGEGLGGKDCTERGEETVQLCSAGRGLYPTEI